MRVTPTSLLLSSILVGLYVPSVIANDSKTNALISEIVSAIPIERVPPRYPRDVAMRGQEGWAAYSFIIEKDGSVSSPILEDSSGNRDIERSAKRAIKSWTYQPATLNGEPVQQCNQSVRLDFSLDRDGEKPGATRRFIRAYKSIQKAINDKEFEHAKLAMDKLKAKPRWNLYEDAWFSQLEAKYYLATGDNESRLDSLKRAISGRNYLPKDMLRAAYVNAFALSAESNRLADALRYYEGLTKTDGSEEQVARLATYVEQINSMINNDKLIVSSASLPEYGRWHHQLVRNQFSIADIEGGLTSLEIRCENKAYSYKVSDNHEWKIPEQYGQCNIYVHGLKDTSFKLIELPNRAKRT